MADGVPRQGYALRVYQILFVLALGWLAGRLPGLVAENDAEKDKLAAAFGVEQPYDLQRAPAGDETARLAADVASRVAAEVADQTLRRLIAAGWAPPAGSAMAPVSPVHAAIPRETVVRVISETAPSPLAWNLPPSAPSLALVPETQVAAQPAAVVARPSSIEGRAHEVATRGYAALKAGDRRQAATLLAQAAGMAPDAAAAPQWVADARQLTKRWSIAGYVLSRGGGIGDPLAASPVLGGGQAGAAAGYTFNPLSNTPVSLVGRVTAAAGPGGGLDGETTEAALGLRVQPLRSIPVAVDVERRFALGLYSRNAWAARVSGGGGQSLKVAGKKLRLEGYGEAGVIGFEQEPALYGGAQLRGATPLATFSNVAVDAGGGAWGGAQRDYGFTASRFDIGPSAQFHTKPWPFRAQVDYRFRVAGNAVPGSGPVITLAGEF